MSLDASTARHTHRTLEPIHGMIYFTPLAEPLYRDIGLEGDGMGYFASRAAAMGAVDAGVVVATFFNFNPAVVHRVIPRAWDLAAPDVILRARYEAADRSLRKAWGDGIGSPEVAEAAALARTAAEEAARHPEGRPLFAAHAGLAWPEAPHLVLWHAQSLLREHRGDAHVALLATAGLDPVEALVVHAATGAVPARALQSTRAWDDARWDAGIGRVRARGWLEDGSDLALSTAGREHRRSIEHRTDELAAQPYEAIGEDGCRRLQELGRPLSRALVDAGLIHARFLAPEPPETRTTAGAAGS